MVLVFGKVHTAKGDFDSQKFFIKSLALSDMFCGWYLMIILVADFYFEGNYAVSGRMWKRSLACHAAAIMASVSYLTSMILLLLITHVRYISITRLKSTFWQSKKKAITSSLLSFLFTLLVVIIILIMSVVTENDFVHSNSLCLIILNNPSGSWYITGIIIICIITSILVPVTIIVLYLQIYN